MRVRGDVRPTLKTNGHKAESLLRQATNSSQGGKRKSRGHRFAEDRLLVNRCLAGESEAWEHLFKVCHPPLLTLIKTLLGPRAADADLTEEMAGRVWYSVVTEPHRRLDPYDPDRGCSLTTYLAALARNEIRQYFRAEVRRRNRERTASQGENDLPSLTISEIQSMLDEFDKTLTPREKEFFESNLIELPVNGKKNAFSETNSWQLRHRVQRKLSRFLEKA